MEFFFLYFLFKLESLSNKNYIDYKSEYVVKFYEYVDSEHNSVMPCMFMDHRLH